MRNTIKTMCKCKMLSKFQNFRLHSRSCNFIDYRANQRRRHGSRAYQQ